MASWLPWARDLVDSVVIEYADRLTYFDVNATVKLVEYPNEGSAQ
ncbi:MAG: hypothetical protein P8M16_03440 [Acidimicrobiales bacterium]|nr:hypothetical protein [Acidimicrobiales bacterium]